MEMAAMPPTTPPAMAPALELLPPEPGESTVNNGVGVVVVVVTWTPSGLKNVLGPYSGLSMSNIGEFVTEGERNDRGHDTHHLLEALRKRSSYSLSRVYCEYVTIEENLETNRDIESSPVRDIYTRRDRVWEPGDQFQRQT